MIKLKSLILENEKSYGCIMAEILGESREAILKYNKNHISDNVIYDNPKHEFGREMESHITIKFGLTKDYKPFEIDEMFSKISPFNVSFSGISLFENDKFDVVKLDVESNILKKLNEQFSKLPNEDEHPEYHPHCTLAYVKKGEGKQFIDKNVEIPDSEITQILYSRKDKKKTHHTL
jgi:2'-5' RNA ligase